MVTLGMVLGPKGGEDLNIRIGTRRSENISYVREEYCRCISSSSIEL